MKQIQTFSLSQMSKAKLACALPWREKVHEHERIYRRWFALLLLFLLWGGGLSADAAERAWAKYSEGTLTFYYGEKSTLGSYEYELNEGDNQPGWQEHVSDIRQVVFTPSFAKARPTSCYAWFDNFYNLTRIDGISNLNTSKVTNMGSMFSNCFKLTTLDVSGFNTANVTNMGNMFLACSQLTTLDVSKFNTAKVTNMANMFYRCSKLTTLDVSGFNTANVTSMESMFQECSQLTTLDLSGFNTANVTNMKYLFSICSQLQVIYVSDKFVVKDGAKDNRMFYGCTSLSGDIDFKAAYIDKTYAKVDGGYFTDKQYTRPWAQYADGTLTFRYGYKKDLGSGEYALNEDYNNPGWQEHVSNITQVVFEASFAKARPTLCCKWFYNCDKLTRIDGISNLNTSEVTDMRYMFSNCCQLSTLDVSKFNTVNVTDMESMFSNCSQLTTLDVSGFNTEKVTDMRYMFYECSQLTTLDVSKFSTENVTNMRYMFYECSQLTTLNVSKFNTVNVTDMESMFSYCSQLATLDVSKFNTVNVTDMESMFSNCSQLTTLDVSKFNTVNVTDMNSMFSNCSQLTTLDLSNFNTANVKRMLAMFTRCSQLTTLDLSNFNTANVTDMKYMFEGCSKLTTLDVSEFNTAKVTDMSYMFSNCSLLTTLDVSKFNTSNVTGMSYMFSDCSLLTTLDVSKFNTSNVTDMSSMFNECSQLTTLDVSKFNTSNVTDMNDMFYRCSQLTTLDLSGFNTVNVTNMKAMFTYCEKLQYIYLGAGFSTDNVTSYSAIFYVCPATLYCLPDCYEGLSKNRFLIDNEKKVKPYVPINAKAEYGTLCVPIGSKLTEGAFMGFDKLYTVKNADTDKATVTLTEATKIEAGVPYVYHRSIAEDAPAIIAFEADDDEAIVPAPKNEDSMLKGTFERITAPGGCYILQTDGMFHPVASGNSTLSVGAYRAYLDPNSLGGETTLSKSLHIVFGGNATGIDNIFYMNDEPKIYFDLSGRRVMRPQRGHVYILKGKKINL